MSKFRIDGNTFTAEQCVNGVLVNPTLPKAFDNTPNERRPSSHRKWWNRPFILTQGVPSQTDPEAINGDSLRRRWIESWPSGTRYDVRCLDGGAWDRSTCWGSFATIDMALTCAAVGPVWLVKKTEGAS
jgi:hypothetical protein